MDMRKMMPAMLLVALWTVPVMAAWNPTPTSSCPASMTIAEQIEATSQPETMTTQQMNESDMMCPMVMPMQQTAVNGQTSLQPLTAEQAMPQDAILVTILTPVDIVEVAGQQRLDADIHPSMNNAVVLIPMVCNGQSSLQPMQVSQQPNDIVLLIPLSPTSMAEPASMSIIIEGEMDSVPVNEQASTSGLAVESTNGQTKVMCPK